MKFKILITILISSLLISGCVNKNENIKIGVIGTMTGANSDLAVSGRRGVEVALFERNNNKTISDKKFELVIKDDKNNVETGLTVNKELVEEGVNFVIGHYTSEVQLGVMDYVVDQNILFLSPTVSSAYLSEKDDNFIRLIAEQREQGRAISKITRDRKNKKTAIFFDASNDEFSSSLIDTYKNEMKKMEHEIVLESDYHTEEAEPFKGLVDLLYEKDADSVLMIGSSYSSVSLAKEIQRRNLNVDIYFSIWSNTNSFFEMGGRAIEGTYILGTIDRDSESKAFNDFEKKFIDMFGEKPSFASVYSYEAANILFDAIENTKDHSPEKVKEIILSKKSFNGLQEEFEINEYGDSTREYKVFSVINGEAILQDIK